MYRTAQSRTLTPTQARHAIGWALSDFAMFLSWIGGTGRAFDGGSAQSAGGFTSQECVYAAASYHERALSADCHGLLHPA